MSSFQAAVGGRYTGLKIRRNAGKPNEYVEEFPGFNNLILDGFFTRWPAGALSSSGWRFFVGTGSNEPTVEDSALVSQLGSASGTSSSTVIPTFMEGSDYYAAVDQIAEWPLGALVGNLTEIGACFRNRTTGTELDTRSLLKDSEGAPTAITITADDQLIVNYRLTIKLPITQHTGTFAFKGVSTDFVLETLNINNDFGNSWTIGDYLASNPMSLTLPRVIARSTSYDNVTTNPTTGTQYSASISGSAVGSARRIKITASASQLNAPGGVGYLILRAGSNNTRQGILFDPPLNKTSADIMELSFDYVLTRV